MVGSPPIAVTRTLSISILNAAPSTLTPYVGGPGGMPELIISTTASLNTTPAAKEPGGMNSNTAVHGTPPPSTPRTLTPRNCELADSWTAASEAPEAQPFATMVVASDPLPSTST